MPLAKDDFETIAQYIRENLPTWLAEQSLGKPPQVYEIELRERMVRVEEELKNQRDIIKQGFELMDKRFGQVDKRFGQVDKRFEEMLHYMDKRFEQMDKRFEDLRTDTNARFEEINTRFDQLNIQMKRFMTWSFGFTATLAGVIIGVIKFI